MVKPIIEKLKYLALVCFLLIEWQCANQLPPGGGSIDLVPPKIETTYPSNGTTNFVGDYVQFDFSKYVQKRTLQDAIFISPAIEGDLNYDWSGTSVRIYFPAKLKINTTYVISVGTDLVDYNNGNHMAQAYTLTFSTGSKIDKGEIEGKVYSDNPQGVLMYTYLVGDSVINPMIRKPDYVSQAGVDGSFKLLGLAPGIYRVFAVVDKSHTLLYQPDQDKIGIPFNDVHLSESDTLAVGVNFFLTNLDTVKPRLQNAVMTDANHILVDFTRDIDTSIIHSHNFFIFDSTLNKKFIPIYAYQGNKKPNEMVLVTNYTPNLKDEYFIFAKKIKDKLGNIYKNDFSSLTVTNKQDTTQPGIYRTDPPVNSSQADVENQKISFYINDAIDSSIAKTGITFTDTSHINIPFAIHFYDDASFYIVSLNKLQTSTEYLIKINLNKLKNIIGKSYDSVYIYKFSTINGLDFTGTTGKLLNANNVNNPVLVLQGIDKDKLAYYRKPTTDMKFNFNRIQPGKYLLWCYGDADSNNTYTYGKVLPFKPSEKFSFYPDTLNLRPRWTVTGVNFIYKEK
ncbi:MAG TPA: Ig-like domain-containing protein [Ignavibacteriaceae bacterium]|nr:Ig-like domain-containing protein [Ignavibacteriaceae bacterium]